MKIIESYEVKDKFMKTPIGDVEILYVHKTIKYDIFEITLNNGLKLQGSEQHCLITSEGAEIRLKDSLGVKLATIYGESEVISIEFIKHDHCFDITLKDFHLYYTNGVLSHNSGKSVTSGLYLLWKSLFTPNINIGIAANKLSLAMEVLDKVKKVFIELPIWLQQGVTAWNKTFIEFENGTRIMTSATNSDAFRGFSCIEKNEILKVYDCKDDEFKYLKISDIYEVLKNDSPKEKNFIQVKHIPKRKGKNEKLHFRKRFLSQKKWNKRQRIQ